MAHKFDLQHELLLMPPLATEQELSRYKVLCGPCNEEFERVLKEHPNNAVIGNNRATFSALNTAVKQADPVKVSKLLAAGVSVHSQGLLNMTPIETVTSRWTERHSEESRAVILRLLLEAGANPNCRSQGMMLCSPLFNCVQHGYSVLSEILIANGADVDAVVYGEKTLVTLALEKGHNAIAKQLLDGGATPPGANATAVVKQDREPDFVAAHHKLLASISG